MKNIVVGAGVTGITIAERLASKGEEVLIIEKRDTIGGNCYDYFDENKNYIQLYGPHILHTNYKEVWDYLNKFTKFNNYSHKVLCNIRGKLINIPFNLNSTDLAFSKDKAEIIKKVLIQEIGLEKKVPILELRKHNNVLIRELADYVYNNIFLNYTIKQWDLKPDEIDLSVTARVPVFVSKDDRYFQSKWQGIPEKGFTEMLNKMLDNPKIKIILSTDYKKIISNYKYKKLFYTGPLDYFFDYKYGKIKYRKIELKFENNNVYSFQENSVINYPNEFDYTRITEFNKFLFIKNKNTVIAKEFPSWEKGFEAYTLQTEANQRIINKYLEEINKLDNVVFLGRLAECKYYDVDGTIKKVLEVLS
ncbi:MAG: UDP-galactopyranose mutase [archaeon]